MAWISPEQWHQLKAGVRCPMCADIHLEENEFSYLVTEFEHTYVRLPKNQFRRGWTIVVLKRHVSELFELTELELSAFWRDVTLVARALDGLYRPAKVNYAVYGNLCPHLHCHLVLQTFADDPHQPVNMNAEVVLLQPAEYRQAIDALRQALAS
jgi:diadenosine tetraphosphate (Ap4A) HIT family hydrolase